MKKLNLILEEIRPKSILDIGTGTGQYLYQCYHTLPNSKIKLYGLDKESEDNIFSSISEMTQHLSSLDLLNLIQERATLNRFEFYQLYVKHELKSTPKSKANFNQDIHFEYGKSINQIQNEFKKIELILAIRLLHQLDEKELKSFKKSCIKTLSEGGHLFIVLSQEIQNKKYSKKWLELEFHEGENFKTIGYELINKENFILFQKK